MKILYSPGFGAGWSSWMASDGKDAVIFALTYAPLIEALENNRDIEGILTQFKKEYSDKFDDEPYIGGARDLTVAYVDSPFRINEYDGSESIELLNLSLSSFIDPKDFE